MENICSILGNVLEMAVDFMDCPPTIRHSSDSLVKIERLKLRISFGIRMTPKVYVTVHFSGVIFLKLDFFFRLAAALEMWLFRTGLVSEIFTIFKWLNFSWIPVVINTFSWLAIIKPPMERALNALLVYYCSTDSKVCSHMRTVSMKCINLFLLTPEYCNVLPADINRFGFTLSEFRRFAGNEPTVWKRRWWIPYVFMVMVVFSSHLWNEEFQFVKVQRIAHSEDEWNDCGLAIFIEISERDFS